MNKKIILAAVALVALIAVFLGVWALTRPETSQGSKSYTVTVIHSDGTKKDFTYETEENYLGPLLRNEGLVAGHVDGDSFFIDAVDGLTADYSANESWWKVLADGEQALVGVDEIALKDGGVYELQYTIGF